MSGALSRRAALTGVAATIVLAGAAAAAISSAAPSSDSVAFCAALDASDAARERFNGLPTQLEASDPARFQDETALMIAAVNRADAAVPTTWQEYTRLLEHMADDGQNSIDDDNADRLLNHARRLAKMERTA